MWGGTAVPEHSVCGGGWRLVRRSRQEAAGKCRWGWGSGDGLTVEERTGCKRPMAITGTLLCWLVVCFSEMRSSFHILGLEIVGDCLVPPPPRKKKTRTSLSQNLWLLLALLTPPPTLNLSSPGPGLPFPQLLLALSSLSFSLLLSSLLSSRGPVESVPFQVPLTELSLISTVQSSSSPVPWSSPALIFLQRGRGCLTIEVFPHLAEDG